MRVVAALSGGVDSAVAAARAVEAGHDVTAVHLALTRTPGTFRTGARGCCSLEDSRDARRAADVLGIPFYVWDLAERFEHDVVEDFLAEYAAGRTPHPCLRCNESVKFAALLERALALGFDAVATGHYARLAPGPDGVELHRAVDAAKDQSYVLAVLEPWQLGRALFPLGPSTKPQVRVEAAARGLAVADKPDSHDLCFVPDGDTAGFLEARLGTAPGDVVDATTGDVLGRHDGVHRFTVGQRRGLHLSRPAPDGAARYVVGLDADARTVLVGPDELLGIDVVEGEHARWCGPVPAQGTRVEVQWRAHGRTASARVETGDDPARATLVFDEPVRGVAPGQTAAMYDGSRVMGSVTIALTRRLSRTPAAPSA